MKLLLVDVRSGGPAEAVGKGNESAEDIENWDDDTINLRAAFAGSVELLSIELGGFVRDR